MKLIQNTPEWLEARKSKIGASDAPVILGISPWKTPFQLWEEKLGLAESDSQSWAMKAGHAIEKVARSQVEEKLGIALMPMVKIHAERPWMMASLDCMSLDEQTIVEIKLASAEDHAGVKEGKVPAKYFPQLQHQIEVCGLSFSWYCSCHEGSIELLRVEKDSKYIEKMVEEEKNFMKLLRDLEPPPLCTRDYRVKEGGQWEAVAEEWKSANAQLKFYKEKEAALRQQLIDLCEEENSLGHGVRATKVIKKGNVKYNLIPQLKEINLDEYRGPTTQSWRLTQPSTSKERTNV